LRNKSSIKEVNTGFCLLTKFMMLRFKLNNFRKFNSNPIPTQTE
jgi:hypothetical protein